MLFRSIILVFLGLSAGLHAQTSPPVADWLKAQAIPVKSAGIYIAQVEGQGQGQVRGQGQRQGRPMVSLNANTPYNPASVMKLYTSYGALELLGAPYTWKTQVLATSSAQMGILNGDVYLKGSADPSLKIQDVWRLLRDLRLSGVKHIAGDWVFDRSVLEDEKSDPFVFDGEGTRPYNVAPDGLLMSFNATRLVFKPADAFWHVYADPLPLGWQLQGRVAVSNEACGDWRNKLLLTLKPYPVGATGGILQVGGSIAKSCGTQEIYRAIAPAQSYAAGVVSTLWAELGGTHAGSFKQGLTPPDATVLAQVESDPLSTIIRDINKRSNNVMARMLYLNLARVSPATKKIAEQRLRAWLASVGLNDTSLVFDNGSGLSRDERSSAMNIAKLLQYAYAGPLMPEFMSSLAVTAQDGTVQRRMGPAAGTAHLKTGTLKDASALAGYVLGASGKRYVLVGLINHPNTAAARGVLDKLVVWLQQHG